MNPARPAVTLADQITRAAIIARSIGSRPAAGYVGRTLSRVDQLTAFQTVQKAAGTRVAAEAMRRCGWTIEAAILVLAGGNAALERHLNRSIMQ